MNSFALGLAEIHEKLKTGELTSTALIKEAIAKAKKLQGPYNAFVTILEDASETVITDNVLSGIPYALKDNFSTKGILTTGSSNILKDYVPSFDASAVLKLKENGAVCIGKTVMDELAMGGSGQTGHTGPVKNAWDVNRIAGGSSAGSAVAVALGIVPYAIGSDSGDSIRIPAAYNGVVGFKPTYGLISRFGLFAFVSSTDTVGCFTRSVLDAAYVIDALKGKDEKDMTTYHDEIKYAEKLTKDVKGKKLFTIKELNEEYAEHYPDIYENYLLTIEKTRKLGMLVEEVSVNRDLLKGIYGAYFAISCAEATSNNSNLTGIIFGAREPGKTPDEVMFNTRTVGFSEFVKKRFVLGSYILQKENQEKLFRNAQRVRRLIVDKVNEYFKVYDGMLLPGQNPDIAPLIDENIDKLSDTYLILNQYLAIANFGCFPSISIPSGIVRENPVAVNITCATKNDLMALNIAYALESAINFRALNERLGE